MVEIYDLKNKTITRIPKQELAPDYVLTRIEGYPNPVYVSLAQARTRVSLRPLHAGLSDECQRVIRYYMSVLHGVDSRTFDDHVAGFCTERYPVVELFAHFTIAKVYAHFAKSKIVDIFLKHALFQILLRCSLLKRETAREVIPDAGLGRVPVSQIIEYYFNYAEQAAEKEFLTLFKRDQLYAISHH
jgi:hypothetical protein